MATSLPPKIKQPPPKIETYKGFSFKKFRVQHYWRAVAANGNILADSGEGYHNYNEMMAALGQILRMDETKTKIIPRGLPEGFDPPRYKADGEAKSRSRPK